jgi:putative phosphoesterase
VQALLLADTHLPRRARDLPREVWAAVDRADLVVHAGDWVSVDLLDRLVARADVLGCWGNNDGPELRSRLPEVARRTVAGTRLVVVHETGDAKGREARLDRDHDGDVLVFGHSHIPWDSVTPLGMRLLNPGSPTDRRRQPHCTYMTLDLPDGMVVLHRLGA